MQLNVKGFLTYMGKTLVYCPQISHGFKQCVISQKAVLIFAPLYGSVCIE